MSTDVKLWIWDSFCVGWTLGLVYCQFLGWYFGRREVELEKQLKQNIKTLIAENLELRQRLRGVLNNEHTG